VHKLPGAAGERTMARRADLSSNLSMVPDPSRSRLSKALRRADSSPAAASEGRAVSSRAAMCKCEQG
jgi:hypothetical protein